jgi:electron-transferring-flavoprotein dehydrogenase
MFEGAHILSGNVLDPRALNELFPKADPDDNEYGWQLRNAPVKTKVKKDRFSILSSKRRFWFPLPSQMKNRKANYIISLR